MKIITQLNVNIEKNVKNILNASEKYRNISDRIRKKK